MRNNSPGLVGNVAVGSRGAVDLLLTWALLMALPLELPDHARALHDPNKVPYCELLQVRNMHKPHFKESFAARDRCPAVHVREEDTRSLYWQLAGKHVVKHRLSPVAIDSNL